MVGVLEVRVLGGLLEKAGAERLKMAAVWEPGMSFHISPGPCQNLKPYHVLRRPGSQVA